MQIGILRAELTGLEVLISEHMINTGPIIVKMVLDLLTNLEDYRQLVFTDPIIEFKSQIHTIRLGQEEDSFETGQVSVEHTMGTSTGVIAGPKGAVTQYMEVILVLSGGLVG